MQSHKTNILLIIVHMEKIDLGKKKIYKMKKNNILKLYFPWINSFTHSQNVINYLKD